jgi:hypothetical protein
MTKRIAVKTYVKNPFTATPCSAEFPLRWGHPNYGAKKSPVNLSVATLFVKEGLLRDAYAYQNPDLGVDTHQMCPTGKRRRVSDKKS